MHKITSSFYSFIFVFFFSIQFHFISFLSSRLCFIKEFGYYAVPCRASSFSKPDSTLHCLVMSYSKTNLHLQSSSFLEHITSRHLTRTWTEAVYLLWFFTRACSFAKSNSSIENTLRINWIQRGIDVTLMFVEYRLNDTFINQIGACERKKNKSKDEVKNFIKIKRIVISYEILFYDLLDYIF